VLQVAYWLLKLANVLVTFVQQQQWRSEGWDAAVAEQALEIARRTEHAKELFAKVDQMDKQGLDDLSDKLGGGGV
jgi:uncharacterized coiled-coil protein SlyX